MNTLHPDPRTPDGWPPAGDGPRVKVCGLRDPDTAARAVRSGADMIGIVHFPPSPRHVAADEAAAVAEAVRGRALVVALTVDADDAALDAFVSAARPDALQLHGRETPERVDEIAARFALPVMKAFGIGTAEDVARTRDYDCLLLLDARPPKDATRPGGLGRPFDWSLLDALDPSTPFMLSGGLTPQTVAAAVRATRPYGVDVSSGVETGGMKDPEKIAAFVSAARRS
jgi:phosphoribosylanthranilate isomerase